MKKSAIVRIVIWSLVIALLIGFLALGLGYRTYRRSRRALWGNTYVATSPLETQAAVKVGTESRDQVADFTGSCTVTQQMNVRETPSTIATIQGMLQAGDTVTVERTENISGTTWAYISNPIEGWVVAEFLDSGNAASATDNVNVRKSPSLVSEVVGMVKIGDSAVVEKYENVDGRQWAYITSPVSGWVVAEYLSNSDSSAAVVPADAVKEISVDWVTGTITIKSAEVQEISFTETGTNVKYPMVWKLKNNKLSISYCEETDSIFGIHFNRLDWAKDLTILVPKDFSLEELELDTASTSLYVHDLTVREVDIDSADGICKFQNCDISDLDVDTASGDVFLEGTLNTLDFDAASASFTGVLSNVPSRMKIDSMSGALDLTLPEDAGFTVKMDGMSNDFTSDFPTTARNGSHVCGDGRCLIDVDGMSSEVVIRKSGNAPVTEASPTEASETKSPLPPKAPTAPDAPTAPEAPTAP